MPEINLSTGGEKPQKKTSGTDIINNLERALNDPRVQRAGVEFLEQAGYDTSAIVEALEIDAPQKAQEVASMENNTEEIPTMEENNTEVSAEEAQREINAESILQLVDGIAQQSPLGEKTTLGMVKTHVNENREEVNAMLAEQGLQ